MNSPVTKANLKTKLVVATDVRFWHKKTGAERRIHAMLKYLERQGVQISTLFVSPIADAANGRSAIEERQTIRDQSFHVRSLIDDWQPFGLIAKAVWKWKCVANWLSSKKKEQTLSDKTDPSGGRYLSDFESPLFRERFHQMLSWIKPDVVLVQYVSLGYLVPENRSTNDPAYFVDTHDLLSDRFDQFRNHGFDHWIRICRSEESAVLNRFDTIIAIQDDEQKSFREMTDKDTPVIVAGHPSDAREPSTVQQTLNAPHSLGYFASDNPSNVQAIEWFLHEVWPAVLKIRPDTTLLIAGTICRDLDQSTIECNGVRLQPAIDDVSQLYRAFKVAINPVQFGTGLKIKNQEALAHGKPLVVTAQGNIGMTAPDTKTSPIFVSSNASQMADQIVALLSDDELIRQSAETALQFALAKLSPDTIYRSLVEQLRVRS